MGIRKNAAALTDAERDRFLSALLKLKHRPAPTADNPGFTLYDRFVALHGAVMSVAAPGQAEPLNFAHWNIGFCAWHREFLRHFELALQAEEPDAALPYWDWADHDRTRDRVFTDGFLGRLLPGRQPAPMPGGNLAHDGPQPRPAWWPAEGVGWRIAAELQEPLYPSETTNAAVLNATLHRGVAESGGVPVGWPPTAAALQGLIEMGAPSPEEHPFWFFWDALEQGWRTHNAAHNFLGGQMAGSLSPNDPVFWLLHAEVDRLWHLWQLDRLAKGPGTTLADHYPPAGTPSPWDGRPAPSGHYLDDLMWPWVAGADGYAPTNPALAPLLPDFGAVPARRVRDVLDIAALGYSYE
ncbi:MAG TPA: tyrosinase family protein [Polyangiaceae bacterium]|nr:tyrosinase family protein [Polyangiaceae bacterium]